ncbi:MAG: peptidylprolyl isomerase [Nitrospinae bacterium]|nr:peptidylprolyl isomerase [Nitrospinota bacterium]
MAIRILVAVLVLALAAGSLIYSFSGRAAETGASSAQMVKSPEASDDKGKPQFALPGAGKGPDVKSVAIDFNSIPEVIAEVNGAPVKKDLLVRALKGLEQTVKMTSQPLTQERLDKIKVSILDNIISAEILSAQAAKEGVTVDDAAVNEHLTMMKKRFPDEATFKKVMESQGLTDEELKKELALNLRIRTLIEKNVISKITITEGDLRKYFDTHQLEFERPEQVRASHILAKFEKSGDDAKIKESKEKARKKIEAIAKKLSEGSDFAELAKKESDDPGSARNGGDLGLFRRGQMVPEFEKAAFDLAPGKISGIVESPFGFHIIKGGEKKPASKATFAEAKSSIEMKLKNEQANSKVAEYVNGLKQQAKIKKML